MNVERMKVMDQTLPSFFPVSDISMTVNLVSCDESESTVKGATQYKALGQSDSTSTDEINKDEGE